MSLRIFLPVASLVLLLTNCLASFQCTDSTEGCRPDNSTSVLCNNRGDCVCGECVCHLRGSPEAAEGGEVVSGDYCECDNFSCDRHNGKLCSGPDRGECVCGRCQCREEWDTPGYSACECSAEVDTCVTPRGRYAGQVCSGHGTCQCGECRCHQTEEAVYSGRYCQECPTCPGECEQLTPCVQCLVFGTGSFRPLSECLRRCRDNDVLTVEEPLDFLGQGRDTRLCSFIDDDECRATFVYGYYGDTGRLLAWAKNTKECPTD